MTSKKKKSKEDIEKELGLTEHNGNNDDLWEMFTKVTAAEAEKVLFTDDYWGNIPKPQVRSWGEIKTPVRNRLFEAVKKGLEHEVYSDGRPFIITRSAFEWKMKQAITYRLSGKYVPPSAKTPETSTSRASE